MQETDFCLSLTVPCADILLSYTFLDYHPNRTCNLPVLKQALYQLTHGTGLWMSIVRPSCLMNMLMARLMRLYHAHICTSAFCITLMGIYMRCSLSHMSYVSELSLQINREIIEVYHLHHFEVVTLPHHDL